MSYFSSCEAPRQVLQRLRACCRTPGQALAGQLRREADFRLSLLLCSRIELSLPLELLLHVPDVRPLEQNAPTEVLALVDVAVDHQVLVDCVLRRNPVVVLVHEHPLILVDSSLVARVEYLWSSVPLFDLWEVFVQVVVLLVLLRQLSHSEVVLADQRLALVDYHEALRLFSFSLDVVAVAILLDLDVGDEWEQVLSIDVFKQLTFIYVPEEVQHVDKTLIIHSEAYDVLALVFVQE